jgi:hypothetical protein
LEASALAAVAAALDNLSVIRVALVLHADDPVVLASTLGGMQSALEEIAKWAYKHKVAFHVGSGKTVAMVTEAGAAGNYGPLFFPLYDLRRRLSRALASICGWGCYGGQTWTSHQHWLRRYVVLAGMWLLLPVWWRPRLYRLPSQWNYSNQKLMAP